MQVENSLHPSADQMEAFQDAGPDGPIFMVNLLRFKDKAVYEDGRETDLSGREAYGLYGAAVGKLLVKHGGGSVFGGQVTHLTLGAVEDLWDMVAIATYPNRAAMLAMVSSLEYRECAVHRTAGLEGQLNIETVAPANSG